MDSRVGVLTTPLSMPYQRGKVQVLSQHVAANNIPLFGRSVVVKPNQETHSMWVLGFRTVRVTIKVNTLTH